MLALAIGCENVCFRVLVCAHVRQKPCPLCVYIVGVVYVIYVGVCISVRCLCALWCPCLSVIRRSCAFFVGVVCVRSCVPSGNPCTFCCPSVYILVLHVRFVGIRVYRMGFHVCFDVLVCTI